MDTANSVDATSKQTFMKCRAAPTATSYTGDYFWVRQLLSHAVNDEVFVMRSPTEVGERAGKLVFMIEVGGGGGGTLVKVIAAASGGTAGGKYEGKTWSKPTTTLSAAGDLVEADLGTTGVDCLIYNAHEVGQLTHDLVNAAAHSKVFVGVFIGNSDTGLPVYVINGLYWTNCAG